MGQRWTQGLTCLCSILSWPRMNCKTQHRAVRPALPSDPRPFP